MSVVVLCLASLGRALFPSNDATLGLPAVGPASLDPGALILFTDVAPFSRLGGGCRTFVLVPAIRWGLFTDVII